MEKVLIDIFYLIGLCVFILLQGFFINGMYEAFKGSCFEELNKGRVCNGNIFYKISPSFFERNKSKTWALPAFACVKCMSSVWSAITFWPVVVYLFGFHWQEIPIWLFDAGILISVNWLIYKKL